MYGVLLIFDVCIFHFSSQILRVWLPRFKILHVWPRGRKKSVWPRYWLHTTNFPVWNSWCLLTSLSDDHLVVGGEDGIIRIYNLPTMKHSAEEITLQVNMHAQLNLPCE